MQYFSQAGSFADNTKLAGSPGTIIRIPNNTQNLFRQTDF